MLSDFLDALNAGLPDWHRDALCREYPEVTFFASTVDRIGEARLICLRCLVRHECRAWALEHDEAGMWGGMTQHERRELTRQRRAA